jgi:hypothetical protein
VTIEATLSPSHPATVKRTNPCRETLIPLLVPNTTRAKDSLPIFFGALLLFTVNQPARLFGEVTPLIAILPTAAAVAGCFLARRACARLLCSCRKWTPETTEARPRILSANQHTRAGVSDCEKKEPARSHEKTIIEYPSPLMTGQRI